MQLGSLDKKQETQIFLQYAEFLEEKRGGLLKEIQVTQLSAARSRILGDYHMMTGQNPVYIIRSERRATET